MMDVRGCVSATQHDRVKRARKEQDVQLETRRERVSVNLSTLQRCHSISNQQEPVPVVK